MTQFRLAPAHTWTETTDIAHQIWSMSIRDDGHARALIHHYPDRETALNAAAEAGLYPSGETYGPGITTVFVAPADFGGVRNHRLTTRHDRAGVSGIYKEIHGMVFVNTYLNSVESLPADADPETTKSELLGYLPGHCAPDRAYQGNTEHLPRVRRKARRWQTNPPSSPNPVRWIHEPA